MKGSHGNPEDYLFLELLDDGPVLDAMSRLRQIYPNILGIQPAASDRQDALGTFDLSRRELDPEALFHAFFREIQNRPMDAEEAEAFRVVAERALAAEARP
jgi:exonuclease SbcD